MSGFYEGILTGIWMYTKSPLFYVLIGLLLLRVVYRIKRPAIRGAVGEWQVNRKLAKLGDEYRIFSDIYVPNGEGGYTQVDHIVLSHYGVFVIETKHYSGWIYGSERQKNWTQVIYKRKERMYNPIWQNYGHIQSLKGYLHKEELEVHSIISFSSDATFKFKEPFETADVIQIHELNHVIKTYHETVFTEIELSHMNQSLEKLRMTDKQEKRKVKKEHLQSVKSKKREQKPRQIVTAKSKQKKDRINELNQVKIKKQVNLRNSTETLGSCPRCASELVQRKGRFGEFTGCSAYPKCRFTLKTEA
ncbi:NERD domain-containing protein [Sporosarcina aquimarina]|uniref:NERD domain-containing protein n=1 Tax=Sporosarcina aquimarina TaxID=114975 RepID=UPI00203D4E6A|nr:NERD domain-containing protein [Sporosarcina aquimarina]MCM3756355.1 NERD domain-containing protein [Sporosarcina aquimarina]